MGDCRRYILSRPCRRNTNPPEAEARQAKERAAGQVANVSVSVERQRTGFGVGGSGGELESGRGTTRYSLRIPCMLLLYVEGIDYSSIISRW